MPETIDKKQAKPEKAKKVADPVAASVDQASQQMIRRAQDLGIETIFDRAVTMKSCNIGIQGNCCKNCAMGPCRLPLPKAGIEGEDERKGLCGATANTIAARNFARMVAAGEFREDLFYRLKTVTLNLPPLRDRREDLQPLTMNYLARLSEKDRSAAATGRKA